MVDPTGVVIQCRQPRGDRSLPQIRSAVSEPLEIIDDKSKVRGDVVHLRDVRLRRDGHSTCDSVIQPADGGDDAMVVVAFWNRRSNADARRRPTSSRRGASSALPGITCCSPR